MAVTVAVIEVQESKLQRVGVREHLLRKTMGRGQREPALAALVLLLRQENRNARHEQRLRQPLHNRVYQRAQVSLRIQLASKLHQRLAVVDALLIEHPVHVSLDKTLERIENQSGHDDGSYQAPLAQVFEALVYHLRAQRHDAEIDSHQ